MEVVDLTDDASVKVDGVKDDDSSVDSVEQATTASVFSFRLPGRPTPWKRPMTNRYGAMYNPQRDLLNGICASLRNQMTKAPLTGPILMEIDFYFLRPKKHFKKDVYGNWIRKPDRPMNCTICRDIDNLAKLVLDALNGIAYVDDRQVVELRLRKRFSDVKYYFSDNAENEEYTDIRVLAL